jgi:ATP-dependent DNA ligase
MVAKHEDSLYRISDEKPLTTLKNGWIKIKREFVGDFVIIGYEDAKIIYDGNSIDTHEYWQDLESGFLYNLSGEEEAINLSDNKGIKLVPVTKYHYYGWIGAIRYGEYRDGKLLDMGTVSSGLTEESREHISLNKDMYLNYVIELSAMERDKKTTYLRHPVLERFRTDKVPEECNYENQKG